MINKKFLAIDIGGTSIKYGVFNSDLEPIELFTVRTRPWKDALVKQVEHIVKKHLFVDGIAIATAGVVDEFGTIKYANSNIRNYSSFELKNFVKEILNKYNLDIPVKVINDANSAAYAEYVLDPNYKNSVTLTLGTGVGAGIILNGQLLTGVNGTAGELNAIRLFNSKRKVDTELSWSKFVRKLRISLQTDSMDIWDLYQTNNFAKYKLNKYLDKLANLLSIISYTLSVEVIYIGGGFSYCNVNILKILNEKFKQSYSFYNINPVQIKYAMNKNNAGMLGVLHLLIDKHFK
ncbi:ROK family protein [Mycoplasma cottewii]|uniref:ROK family protein n=1 Tax=Mycoplasma cottewii TaxID=51364 RepID=A0ABY5TX90_9MOLU|nr:ROK family protein [Mycoplasma cottewii]UWD35300.1 ROK family protein [Mycoplasma cottewii]